MQIRNIMSEDLVTIDKDQNILDGLKLLRKNNISRLPVINTNRDNERELVGIVSERDIAKKLGSSKTNNLTPAKLHISSVMVKDVIAVDESMNLADVANIMLDNGIGSVPIESNDVMVGIVSKADFVDLCTGRAYDKIKVEDVMTEDVITVSIEDRLVHARRTIIDNKIGRLLVTDEDNGLVGIITSKDIIRALMDFKKKTPEKYQKTQIKNIYIKDIMSTAVSGISKDASISEVAGLMKETGFNGYPVTDENNNVVGIITQTDLLALVADIESE
ncbi:MAG: HPP family protein [Methanobrevibacter sp.]